MPDCVHSESCPAWTVAPPATAESVSAPAKVLAARCSAGANRSVPRSGRSSADSLQPLLLDYFTRDGSTLTMRLLASSPQIAVGGGYPYEHKYFAYLYRWAHLIEKTGGRGRCGTRAPGHADAGEADAADGRASLEGARAARSGAGRGAVLRLCVSGALGGVLSPGHRPDPRSAQAAGRRRPLLRREAPQQLAGGPERAAAGAADRRAPGPSRHVCVDHFVRGEAREGRARSARWDSSRGSPTTCG